MDTNFMISKNVPYVRVSLTKTRFPENQIEELSLQKVNVRSI